MRETRKFCAALVWCVVVLSLAVAAPPRRNNKTLRVLFIGNSYTYFNNLPEQLAQLAASAGAGGQPLAAEMVTRGGATLQWHWESGAALERLRNGRWDYVVLQEQSLRPLTEPAAMHRYARLFDAEIKKAGAKTIFFLTWARQQQPENQPKLNAAYLSIAKELDALIAPVGIAWQRALRENPRQPLHTEDQSHPNATGSYLAACVFYAVITGKNPESLSGNLTGRRVNTDDGRVAEERGELVRLDGKEAQALQRLAWQTVEGFKN